MELSAEFLALLTSPVSGGALEYDREISVLLSKKAGLTYPIVEGIPLLLESEAQKILTKTIDIEKA
jgi:uncharacterized protein YbaR (Trm112 family)